MRRVFERLAILTLVVAAVPGGVFAQRDARAPASEQSAIEDRAEANDNSLSEDDRLSLLAAALDPRVRRSTEADCSHLVHAIYEQAGMRYAYATSKELYSGSETFQRVKTPEPGDLIVWRGHVGIVIKPSQHIFFSFMSSGPGIDDYQSPYWKHRGKPRFYRYVKTEGCCDAPSPAAHRLVKVKK